MSYHMKHWNKCQLPNIYLPQNLLSVGLWEIIVQELANVLMHWWSFLLCCIWTSIRRVDIEVGIFYHGIISATGMKILRLWFTVYSELRSIQKLLKPLTSRGGDQRQWSTTWYSEMRHKCEPNQAFFMCQVIKCYLHIA